jgi:hypothetical protein
MPPLVRECGPFHPLGRASWRRPALKICVLPIRRAQFDMVNGWCLTSTRGRFHLSQQRRRSEPKMFLQQPPPSQRRPFSLGELFAARQALHGINYSAKGPRPRAPISRRSPSNVIGTSPMFRGHHHDEHPLSSDYLGWTEVVDVCHSASGTVPARRWV